MRGGFAPALILLAHAHTRTKTYHTDTRIRTHAHTTTHHTDLHILTHSVLFPYYLARSGWFRWAVVALPARKRIRMDLITSNGISCGMCAYTSTYYCTTDIHMTLMHSLIYARTHTNQQPWMDLITSNGISCGMCSIYKMCLNSHAHRHLHNNSMKTTFNENVKSKTQTQSCPHIVLCMFAHAPKNKITTVAFSKSMP